MTRIHIQTHANEDCPNCGTTHVLPIESDEDGYYVQIDTEVCNDDHCTRQLCSACPQFACAMCYLRFCAEHGTQISTGGILCQVCADIVRAEAIEVKVVAS